MEKAGGQVITPIATYKDLVGRFCNSYPTSKKRGVGARSPSAANCGTLETWNVNSWDWDPARFVAKPLHCDELIRTSSQGVLMRNGDRKKDSNAPRVHPMREDEENISSKLGNRHSSVKSGKSGEANSKELDPASKPTKRIRAGSPCRKNPLACQVDGCNENLSTAKDYNRRHKVCDIHSKAAEALVGKEAQRFCQQCSRFHLLTEFDAGKRSCRLRLAGHNHRRRKTQLEDSNLQLLVPQSCDKNISDVDIVNLASILSQAQGIDRSTCRSFQNNGQLVQVIGNVTSSLPESSIPMPTESFQKHVPTQSKDPTDKEITPPSPNQDLIAVLPASSPAFHTHNVQSDQTSNDGSESEKNKSNGVNEAVHLTLRRVERQFPSVGHWNGTTSSSPKGDMELNFMRMPPNLPLRLFSCSHDEHQLRKSQQDWSIPSSQSIKPTDEDLLFSPRPVIHDFFAIQSSRENLKHSNSPNTEFEIPAGRGNASNLCSTSLQLFAGSSRFGENGSFWGSHYHTEQASTSGSYYSMAALKPGSQDCTGRIIFKLFDKDPSHLPMSLRTQIYNWLSSSPSDMESYIRPGCIVLSLYVSMPLIEWNKLEENLPSYLKTLVDDIDAEFWGTGRFLIRTKKHFAVSNEGKIQLCKSWRTHTPELISVSPLAVVSTQETSLLLKGRELLTSNTKIHCTHAVGYCIEKSMSSSAEDSLHDEIILSSFKINDAAQNRLGRCFIEVENGSRYASFPIIIANEAICTELKLLEPEIDYIVKAHDDTRTCPSQDEERPDSREWALHFLNDLGWLFQKKCSGTLCAVQPYSLIRLKFLLTFSVERDFCAVVKTLLDILVEMNLSEGGLVQDSLEMLSEVHLLNRAIKRRCQGMVNMLIEYSVIDPTHNSKKYIFLVDTAGPGGITPLHIAASLPNADSIVDALTSDPLNVGLKSWGSALDEQGLSPYAYASMRNHHSYNSLVAQKLEDRNNEHVSISIDAAEHLSLEIDRDKNLKIRPDAKWCSNCKVIASLGYGRKIPGSRAFLKRSYIHSILVVAAVSVCVCVLLRGHPHVGYSLPFAWDQLDYGSF